MIYKLTAACGRLKLLLLVLACSTLHAEGLKRIRYNHPDLITDLGGGLWAWPIPMDFDQDGDNDLLVVYPDKPWNGTYFFENPDGQVKMPVFLPPVKVGVSWSSLQPSYIDGRVRLLNRNQELIDYKINAFKKTSLVYPTRLPYEPNSLPASPVIRANQWKFVDYDGDDRLDLIVALEDLTDYGWDNAFDGSGRWVNGPLHGYLYWIRNTGTNAKPTYETPVQLKAAGSFIDVYGRPSPNFCDFDHDGDLDLLCGEFLDGFTYFQNIGSRRLPVYAAERRLSYKQHPLQMDLQMIIPVAFDWDQDGDMDLIVGDEDGRVALLENTGVIDEGMPQFLPPAYFQQKADEVKIGALATPFSADWDSDGDEDLICGNTAGYLVFLENLDGGCPPKWAAPVLLHADSKPIRITAGYNGSIQGPCEAKWGYTTPWVADWDGDGRLDIVINSIWGKIQWFRNIGTPQKPQLAAARPVRIHGPGRLQKPSWNWWTPEPDELVTQWRTTPCVIDWNQDGLQDLVMLDYEGYLAFFERVKRDDNLVVLPGKRIFFVKRGTTVELFRPNEKPAGKSGRRQFCFADWDQDGRLDLLIDSVNINFLRNVSVSEAECIFEDQGAVDPLVLAGHSTRPAIVNWDKDRRPDLLVGAEDGHLYYLANPHPETGDGVPLGTRVLTGELHANAFHRH